MGLREGDGRASVTGDEGLAGGVTDETLDITRQSCQWPAEEDLGLWGLEFMTEVGEPSSRKRQRSINLKLGTGL